VAENGSGLIGADDKDEEVDGEEWEAEAESGAMDAEVAEWIICCRRGERIDEDIEDATAVEEAGVDDAGEEKDDGEDENRVDERGCLVSAAGGEKLMGDLE